MRKVMAIVLTATALLAVGSVPAAANEDDVIQRGSCSGRTDWKLKASPEDGGIEAEFEVDQNMVGDDWRVRIIHDGERIFSGVRTTRGASGSFEVEIVEDDRAGTDRFVGKARNLSTDETCRGSVAF
jgi:hypothetical protein